MMNIINSLYFRKPLKREQLPAGPLDPPLSIGPALRLLLSRSYTRTALPSNAPARTTTVILQPCMCKCAHLPIT